MPAVKILFGRATRFTCDALGCDVRQATDGELPQGWTMKEDYSDGDLIAINEPKSYLEFFCEKHDELL